MRIATILGLSLLVAGCGGSDEPVAEAAPSAASSAAPQARVEMDNQTFSDEGPAADDWGSSGDVASDWAADDSAVTDEPEIGMTSAPPPRVGTPAPSERERTSRPDLPPDTRPRTIAM